MKHRREVTLQQLLEAETAGVALASPEPGDRALLGRRYEEAASAYAKHAHPSKALRAKHGYALAILGRNAEAIELLNRDNVGTHPEALAVLVWALWYGGDHKTSRHPHRDSCRELLVQVQAHPSPSAIAFRVLLDLWFEVSMDGRPESEAERAVELHPTEARFVAILARERRIAGRTNIQTIDLLTPFLDAKIAGILEEAFLATMSFGRHDVLQGVLDRLRAGWAGAHGHTSEQHELDKLIAYSDWNLARAGDAAAAQRGWERVAPLIASSTTDAGDSGTRALDTCRLAVCLAAELKDQAAIQSAVSALVSVAYDPEINSSVPDVCFFRLDLDEYDESFTVQLEMPWVDYDSVVRPQLETAHSLYWGLLVACARVMCGSDTEADRAAIASDGPIWGPLGELSTMCQTLVEADPLEIESLGILLARAACVAEDGHPELAAHLKHYLHSLQELDDDDFAAVFEAGVLAMEEQEAGTGEGMLTAWGEQLGARAPAVLQRLGHWIQQRTGRTPDLPVPPDPVAAYLASLPGSNECPSDPSELSLLEAAALIAVLRSDMDHARWTLAPLQALGQPFEPESAELRPRRFMPVLFDLLRKGVVGIASNTAAGVVTVNDGKVSAYLDRITWTISPATLALYRAVRDLPHDQWPDAWREQAPVLARDLGAQELLVYMTHMCGERRLERPEDDVVMPHLRALLEQRSIAHGYYIVHKTVRETADHYTKYRPRPQALVTRMHNLLRGNIEKTLAAEWDTEYDREKDLPESLLFDALHRTLTKWGDTSFRTPVYDLALDDRP